MKLSKLGKFFTTLIILTLCLAGAVSAKAATAISVKSASVDGGCVIAIDPDDRLDEAKDAFLVVAEYDGDGQMTDCEYIETFVAPTDITEVHVETDAETANGGRTVKAFLVKKGTETPLADSIRVLAPTVRICIDGDMYQSAALSDGDGELYLSADALTLLTDEEPSDTVSVYGTYYADARKSFYSAGFGSYEYEPALGEVYVWTELASAGDEDRIKHYGLGDLSDKPVTYDEFFAILDKAVQAAAGDSALADWQTKLPRARAATRQMTRMEGMMAVLHAAIAMGSDYPEFNVSWQALNDAMGEGVWDEISAIETTKGVRYWEYIDNTWPYTLGGFTKDNYVYDGWNVCGVAFRYAFGRASNFNGKTLFDYDGMKNSMRTGDWMTVTEALTAVSRLLDSVMYDPTALLAELNDQRAAHFSDEIITPALLARANTMQKIAANEQPQWHGLVLNSSDYESTSIDDVDLAEAIRKTSEWGFDCGRVMVTYESLFNGDITKANVTNLEKLDKLVAAAMEYRLHITIVTFSLPGRWTHRNPDNYTWAGGEFDLFTNKARQAEAEAMWELLATRYADVPNSVLSFQPIWEAMNYDLSSGQTVNHYTASDVAAVYDDIVKTIHGADPDRLVIYEPTANNMTQWTIDNEAKDVQTVVENNDYVQLLGNFCEAPFVYAEMTATSGENIDYNNHSIFKPEYPVDIYSCQRFIDSTYPLVLNGGLPEGTKVTVYLSKVTSRGDLMITADSALKSTQALSEGSFICSPQLSRYYPFAVSDKPIVFTLENAADTLTFAFTGYLEISGIDVTLPDSYAKWRWWFPSDYDKLIGHDIYGSAVAADARAEKRLTSNIQISPNPEYVDCGAITINPDGLYFTTQKLFDSANSDTIDAWGARVAAFAPGAAVRLENSAFCIGVEFYSALRYYNDLLTACDKYSLGWFMNDYASRELYRTVGGPYRYAGAEATPCNNGYYVIKEMLQTFQSHLPQPITIG